MSAFCIIDSFEELTCGTRETREDGDGFGGGGGGGLSEVGGVWTARLGAGGADTAGSPPPPNAARGEYF